MSLPSTSAVAFEAIAIVTPTTANAGKALRVMICAFTRPLGNNKEGRFAFTDLAVKISLRFFISSYTKDSPDCLMLPFLVVLIILAESARAASEPPLLLDLSFSGPSQT